MEERFARLPQALEERTLRTRLAQHDTPFDDAGVPALLAHPEPGWSEPDASPEPTPVVVWMHGRTVSKEMDPGRYLRWARNGLATCSIDLPYHGERADEEKQTSEWTLKLATQCVREIDHIIDALREPRFNGAFDTERMAIGGMSAGGMVTLIRLCRPHRFRCATVEGSAGNFRPMRGHAFYVKELAERLNPIDNLGTWRPIPFLALHSEADAIVPFEAMRSFVMELKRRYAQAGATRTPAELVSWPHTGAPEEHIGFGRFANEAKTAQLEFLKEHLGAPSG